MIRTAVKYNSDGEVRTSVSYNATGSNEEASDAAFYDNLSATGGTPIASSSSITTSSASSGSGIPWGSLLGSLLTSKPAATSTAPNLDLNTVLANSKPKTSAIVYIAVILVLMALFVTVMLLVEKK